MPTKHRYRCQHCGERFEVDILTPEEKKAARQEHRPLYAIQCPACKRSYYREGWE